MKLMQHYVKWEHSKEEMKHGSERIEERNVQHKLEGPANTGRTKGYSNKHSNEITIHRQDQEPPLLLPIQVIITETI